MDEWSILDEVDVLAKWPAEHKKAVLEAGAKWKERKEGLEALNTIIEQNPRLSTATMTIYGELMDEIRKILDRESNIVVVTTSIRTVELLARGLRHKFAGFIGMVVPFLIKRAKDKKKNVRDAVLAAMAAVSDTTSAERLQKDLIDWFGIPSPESKQTLLAFLFAYFCRQSTPDIPFVKAVAPMVVKTSSESDVAVRDKACQALGGLKRLMGEAISAFLVPISSETAKLEKIQQYQEEAVEEYKKYLESQPKAADGEFTTENSDEKNGLGESAGGGGGGGGATTSSAMDPWDVMDAEDVSKKIDKGVEAQLVDKNWKERVAGGESVKKSMEGILRIELSDRLVEIVRILIKIIEKDVNVNVAALSAQILKDVAQKCRFGFSSLAHRAFPVIFDKLKDKKAVLRDALVECCDEAANTTPLSAYSDAVITALASKNPQTRQQIALFLSRFFAKNDSKTVEIEAIKQLAGHILKTTNDADKEVREAALRVVAAVQKSMGEGIAKRLLGEVYEDKLKAEKIPTIIEELETEFGKCATPEMLRLAKNYKIGSTPSSSGAGGPPKPRAVSAMAPRPAPPRSSVAPSRPPPSTATTKPSGTVRPVQSAGGPRAPPTRRAPSPKTVAPVTAAPKPFVARPAPNFGGGPPKPRATVAPASSSSSSSRPAVRAPPTRPTSSVLPRQSTASAGPVRVTPIAPNVVRRQAPPTSSQAPPTQKPIGIARPQTASSSGITAPRSRISAPVSGLARPSSSISRPQSGSRIARPGSRNE